MAEKGAFLMKNWKFALKMQKTFGQNSKFDKCSGILVLNQCKGVQFNAAIRFWQKIVFDPIWPWFLIFHATYDLNGLRYVP